MAVRKKTSVSVAKPKMEEQTFSKKQILASKRYADLRDLVSAFLEDGKCYTLDEVDKMIEQYMKGKVN